jgi:hypothetical protein
VDGEIRPGAVLVGVDGDLELYGAFVGEDQGRLQGEFLHPGEPDAGPGVHGHLDQGRARHDHRAENRVVREPRVSGKREPSREHQAASVGEFDRRGQQRVTTRRLAQPGRVRGGR